MILIVNDDKDMLDVLEMVFIHQQYQVVILDSTEDIEMRLLKNKPDLVILGFLSPDRDKDKLINSLKSMISSSNIPFIILSADADISDAFGENVFVVNPLNLFFLSKQVKRIFREDIIN